MFQSKGGYSAWRYRLTPAVYPWSCKTREPLLTYGSFLVPDFKSSILGCSNRAICDFQPQFRNHFSMGAMGSGQGGKPNHAPMIGPGGRAESAGINRHRVGDERALHKRRSCSIMAPSHVRVAARRHVKQLTGESAGQPLSSEITYPGCRPSGPKGKATL